GGERPVGGLERPGQVHDGVGPLEQRLERVGGHVGGPEADGRRTGPQLGGRPAGDRHDLGHPGAGDQGVDQAGPNGAGGPAGADPAEPTASGAEADPTATSRAEVAPTATRPEAPRTVRFPFEFDARFVPLALPFGVLPTTAYIEVGDGEVLVRFGPWSLST